MPLRQSGRRLPAELSHHAQYGIKKTRTDSDPRLQPMAIFLAAAVAAAPAPLLIDCTDTYRAGPADLHSGEAAVRRAAATLAAAGLSSQPRPGWPGRAATAPDGPGLIAALRRSAAALGAGPPGPGPPVFLRQLHHAGDLARGPVQGRPEAALAVAPEATRGPGRLVRSDRAARCGRRRRGRGFAFGAEFHSVCAPADFTCLILLLSLLLDFPCETPATSIAQDRLFLWPVLHIALLCRSLPRNSLST